MIVKTGQKRKRCFTDKKFWIPIVSGIIATPVFLLPLFVMAMDWESGGGQGYATVILPWPSVFDTTSPDTEERMFVLVLALQFPIYGVTLWIGKRKKSIGRYAASLVSMHLLASLLAVATNTVVWFGISFWTRLVFPCAHIICLLMRIIAPVGGFLVFTQFIIYGVILGIGWHRERLKYFAALLIIVHIVGVVISLVINVGTY